MEIGGGFDSESSNLGIWQLGISTSSPSFSNCQRFGRKGCWEVWVHTYMGRKGELPLFFHPCLQLLLFFLHDQARIYRGERGLRTYLAVALIRLEFVYVHVSRYATKFLTILLFWSSTIKSKHIISKVYNWLTSRFRKFLIIITRYNTRLLL